jgi:predicted transcriptional regulator of viral defense system
MLYIHVMRGRVQSMADTLFEIAEGQQGYFTAKQAADAGYRLGSQAHHARAGNWVRIYRGIYRLGRFPQSDEEQLVIYSLWSRNRSGSPEGVYSHQTALNLYELSDINPAKLHLTVPPTFRRSAPAPKILVLHRAVLDEKDLEQRQGFKVVRPIKTIIDLAANEVVSREIIEQALTEGRRRGLITTREIGERRCETRQILWLDTLFSKAAK